MKKSPFAFHQHLTFFRKNRIQIARLKETLAKLCADFHQVPKKIDIIFVNDEELLQMNRDFLAHDYYTDIITFDLSESASTLQGELYISCDRVSDNALNLQCPVHDEIIRVCIHGVLHLCGMDDGTAEEKNAMRQAENKYIQFYKEIERNA